MPWDLQQYDRFKRERSAPVDDLMSLLKLREDVHAVDLGCGSGEYTRRLHDALPGSTVTGIDNSPEMLTRSSSYATENCRFVCDDIAHLSGVYDLIFSNAALHWCPDHPSLFRHLWNCMNASAQLLVQMPTNHAHPSHALAYAIAHDMLPDVFPARGSGSSGSVMEIEEYASLLFDLGAEDIVVFAKVYPHVLADSDDVVEWVKGTLLVPIMEAMSPEQQQIFMQRYRHELARAMPSKPVFYGFKRIVMSARKPI